MTRRCASANAVTEQEAKDLYETFAVPAPGEPLTLAFIRRFH